MNAVTVTPHTTQRVFLWSFYADNYRAPNFDLGPLEFTFPAPMDIRAFSKFRIINPIGGWTTVGPADPGYTSLFFCSKALTGLAQTEPYALCSPIQTGSLELSQSPPQSVVADFPTTSSYDTVSALWTLALNGANPGPWIQMSPQCSHAYLNKIDLSIGWPFGPLSGAFTPLNAWMACIEFQ